MKMKIKDAAPFSGYPAKSKNFDNYLTSIGIIERPVFDENPTERINKFGEGFSLIFDERLGYEEFCGAACNDAEMIFCALQIYGERNDSGFSQYTGVIPFGITFTRTLSNAISLFGNPTTDHPSGPENRVYVWYGFQGQTIGIYFLPQDTGISFIDIAKAKLQAPEKLDW